METFDVDECRAHHESSTEWTMKRNFITTHMGKFPKDRIICLANCYVNVQCYGTGYPLAVMGLLKELVAQLADVSPSKMTNYQMRNQVKFVKSSESTASEPMEVPHEETSSKSIFDAPVPSVKPAVPKKKTGMAFVKATDTYESTDVTRKSMAPTFPSTHFQSQEPSQFIGSSFKETLKDFQTSAQSEEDQQLLQKFYTLSSHVRDLIKKRKGSVETVQWAVDKTQMLASPVSRNGTDPSAKFLCELKIDFVIISTGKGTSKKAAKVDAYDKARDIFRKPYLRIVETTDGKVLHSSAEPLEDAQSSDVVNPRSKVAPAAITKLGKATEGNIHALAKSKKRSPDTLPPHVQRTLSEFLLVEPQQKADCVNSRSILCQSADINKAKYEQIFTDVAAGAHCVLRIAGQTVVDMTGPSRVVLKVITADKALEMLREVCWTIQIKKNEDCDEDGISRESLLGNIKSDLQSGKIGDSNIGNQLLKKMGWTGGGLGKDSKGISEPIAAGGVINREGLGLQAEKGINKSFLPQVKETLRQYMCSGNENDTVFSPDFQKEERAIIHKEAQKLGLKTHSHGTGDNRYLVISRKRNAGELFTHVMKSGGETSKYSLLPPGSHTETSSMFDP